MCDIPPSVSIRQVRYQPVRRRQYWQVAHTLTWGVRPMWCMVLNILTQYLARSLPQFTCGLHPFYLFYFSASAIPKPVSKKLLLSSKVREIFKRYHV